MESFNDLTIELLSIGCSIVNTKCKLDTICKHLGIEDLEK